MSCPFLLPEDGNWLNNLHLLNSVKIAPRKRCITKITSRKKRCHNFYFCLLKILTDSIVGYSNLYIWLDVAY